MNLALVTYKYYMSKRMWSTNNHSISRSSRTQRKFTPSANTVRVHYGKKMTHMYHIQQQQNQQQQNQQKNQYQQRRQVPRLPSSSSLPSRSKSSLLVFPSLRFILGVALYVLLLQHFDYDNNESYKMHSAFHYVQGQPVLSPSVANRPTARAPNFGYLPCSVCGAGSLMKDPSNTVPAGTVSFLTEDIVCIRLEQRAQNAEFSPLQCVEARQSDAPDICGCAVPPTQPPETRTPIAPTSTTTPTPVVVDTPSIGTESPTTPPSTLAINTTSPTETVTTSSLSPTIPETTEVTGAPSVPETEAVSSAPSAVPMAAPTEKPTAVPTRGPTVTITNAKTITPTRIETSTPSSPSVTLPPTSIEAPTDEQLYYTVNGEVQISLQPVAATMTDPVIETYNEVLSLFFAESFANESSPVLQVEAVLTDQSLQSGTESDSILVTFLNVSGLVPKGSTRIGESLTPSLVSAVNDDGGSELLGSLQGAESVSGNFYFDSVSELVAADPATVDPIPSPVLAPAQIPSAVNVPTPPAGDDGISSGAIAGIIAGVAIVAIVAAILGFAQSNKRAGPSLNDSRHRQSGTEGGLAAASGASTAAAVSSKKPAEKAPLSVKESSDMKSTATASSTLSPQSKSGTLSSSSPYKPTPEIEVAPSSSVFAKKKPEPVVPAVASSQPTSAYKLPPQQSTSYNAAPEATDVPSKNTAGPAIGAAAVAGALGAAVFAKRQQDQKKPDMKEEAVNDDDDDDDDHDLDEIDRKAATVAAQTSEPSSGVPVASTLGPTDKSITAQSAHSYNYNVNDDNSLMDQNTYDGAATADYGGNDAMSYAYSLDAGNVDGGGTFVGGGGTVGGGTTSSAYSAMTGTLGNASVGAGGTGLDMGASASGSALGTQSGDDMSSHAMSSLRQNMVSRTVIAPPGKLGIVIDTTLEGPVVHKVNPQSPLEGLLFPGDIIIAIDDVDTRAMSASAITALMVRTANLRRKLTVLSEDITN